MVDVSEIVGKIFRDGTLLTAEFCPREFGTVDVCKFDSLAVVVEKDQEASLKMSGVRFITGAQEAADWSCAQRQLEPYNRTSPKTHIGCGFDLLEIIKTLNRSRFLVFKEAWTSDMVSVGDLHRLSIGMVFLGQEQKLDLPLYLADVLRKMGVPSYDITRIRDNILGKLD